MIYMGGVDYAHPPLNETPVPARLAADLGAHPLRLRGQPL